MIIVKSFASHTAFTKNSAGQDAVIGELSQYSKTFSKEVGLYADDVNYPSILLTVFTAIQDDAQLVVPNTIRDIMLRVSKYTYDYTINQSGQRYRDELLNALLADFAADANTFDAGDMVTDGTYWMPEWVSFKMTNPPAGQDTQLKMWFVDSNFQSHYEDYSYTIVSPLVRVDDFIEKTGGEIKALMAALTWPQLSERINNLAAKLPYSDVHTELFNYIDPQNPANVVPTPWTALVYNPAGLSIDSLKDGFVNWVLANSNYPRDRWVAIFPDLFKRTEFPIIPQWDIYAIPQRTSEAGIYTPQTNLKRALQLIKAFASGYAETHINDHASIMNHPWKSISLVMVGSPENRDSLFELSQVFPDIILATSTSTDFIRMSQDTQKFLNYLSQMLLIAEEMNPYSDLPLPVDGSSRFTKLQRDGKLYVVKSFNNINYLVAAKSNFPIS